MSSQQKVATPIFQITVQACYKESESRPETGYYFFSYKVTIKNCSAQVAQLMSRHWIITDGHGQVEEVRGAGVVGLQPKIQPGQTFEYESACPLTTPHGSMRGFYQMISSSGEPFDIEIGESYLVAPFALH